MNKCTFYIEYIRHFIFERFISGIRRLYFNIKQGFKNIWVWKKVIWNDRDWDWLFLIIILQFKLENMAKYQKTQGMSVDHDKIAEQLHRTALACKRLMVEEYDKPDPIFLKDNKWQKKINGTDFQSYMQQQDIKYITKMINKHIWDWWD